MNADEIINTISERVKDTANVDVVFGEPIESDGVTIIPVAKVKIGGGGGGGRGKKKLPPGEVTPSDANDSGMGLGLQITTTPLGYIEVKDGGEARFINIVDVTKVAIGGLIVAGLAFATWAKAMGWKKMKHHKHHYA